MTPSHRRAYLAFAVIVVSIVLLAVIASRPEPGGDPAPSRLPVGVPPAVASEAAILVGAGDIATCDGRGDEATAALLDQIPGTVFAAGDLAYPHGTARGVRHLLRAFLGPLPRPDPPRAGQP